MAERELSYSVSLKKGVDRDDFIGKIRSETNIDFVPNRRVETENKGHGIRHLTKKSFICSLSVAERDILRKHPDVEGIDDWNQIKDVPFRHYGWADAPLSEEYKKYWSDRIYNHKCNPNTKHEFQHNPIFSQGSEWQRSWGLAQINAGGVLPVNTPFVKGYNTEGAQGAGVDIVIFDDGCFPNHPEFWNCEGKTRLHTEINWSSFWTESQREAYFSQGLAYNQNLMYQRAHGYSHGVQVASCALGNWQGMAPKAEFYMINSAAVPHFNVPEGFLYALDSILNWHNNKESHTVVNMSFGWGQNPVTTHNFLVGMPRPSHQDQGNNYFLFQTYITTLQDKLEELRDAGIVIVAAAGNDGTYVETPGGPLWDTELRDVWASEFLANGYTDKEAYRGSTPAGDAVINVGACAQWRTRGGENFTDKAVFSQCGPGVDVYAPGWNVLAADNRMDKMGYLCDGNSDNYGTCSAYKQDGTFGTSFASPYTAGLVALFLGREDIEVVPRDSSTKDRCLDWLVSNGDKCMYKGGMTFTSGKVDSNGTVPVVSASVPQKNGPFPRFEGGGIAQLVGNVIPGANQNVGTNDTDTASGNQGIAPSIRNPYEGMGFENPEDSTKWEGTVNVRQCIYTTTTTLEPVGTMAPFPTTTAAPVVTTTTTTTPNLEYYRYSSCQSVEPEESGVFIVNRSDFSGIPLNHDLVGMGVYMGIGPIRTEGAAEGLRETYICALIGEELAPQTNAEEVDIIGFYDESSPCDACEGTTTTTTTTTTTAPVTTTSTTTTAAPTTTTTSTTTTTTTTTAEPTTTTTTTTAPPQPWWPDWEG